VIDFTIETDIDRPPAEVFAYITDPGKLATWQTNTVSAEVEGGGPLRLGSRLREVHSAPGGKQLESLVEVSEFEPDSRFGLQMLEGKLLVHGLMTLAPAGSGTRMAFRAYGQPTGVLKLLKPILRSTLKRQFAAHCATLKQQLEALPARTA
jgi:uncharacterized protein YndB with AHSA1/START domain